MIKVKNILILISFILLTSCGYSPILNSEKIDFYFSEIKFEGNQQNKGPQYVCALNPSSRNVT